MSISNTGMTKESVLKDMVKFGKQFGEGMQSRPLAAQIAVEAANKNIYKPDTDSAKEIYTAFAKGAAAEKGVEFKTVASFDVQVSKMGVFLKLGALPSPVDGVVVYANTYDAIIGLSQRAENPLKGSAYDLLCKVARRQIASPKTQLTPSEIEDVLLEQPAEKDDIAKVIDLYKRTFTLAGKLAEAGVDVTHIQDGVAMLAAQIKSMGGELPPMTDEQKEIDKATKLLKKNNIVVEFKSTPAAANSDEGEQPELEQSIIDADPMLQAAE